MTNEPGGCYNDCYAAKSAKIYGYDFGKTVLRSFENERHRRRVMGQINRAKLDFIRIGCSGDPSEDWEHTISILKKIDKCNKKIVIITKHWTHLTNEQLAYLGTINVCVNTSVSALDKPHLRESCLEQYNRLKPFCKSILRIVSCDFNTENPTGFLLDKIQHNLFKNDDTLDTVLRVNKNNPLVLDGVINVKEMVFLGQKTLASKLNKNTYFGKCSTCHEMCGASMKPENKIYPDKPPIAKQMDLFRKNKIMP
jgi:cytochrome c553